MRLALIALVSSFATSASAQLKVSGASQVDVTVGKSKVSFYKLAKGATLTVSTNGPGLLDLQVRALADLLGDSKLALTLVRDQAFSSKNELKLGADPTANAAQQMVTVEKSLQASVPAGAHEYRITVESEVEVYLRVSAGIMEMAEAAIAPETPFKALAAVAVEEPPKAKEPEAVAEAAPPPAEAPAMAEAEAASEAPAREEIGLMIALKAALLIPSGRPADAQALAGAFVPKAGRTASYSGSFEVRYAFPFLKRALALDAEAGIYPLSGKGKREFPFDPDFKSFDYDWSMLAIPLTVGPAYKLPLAIPLVTLWARAGFAAVHVTSQTSWKAAGQPAVADAEQVGWAYGFYLGAEGSIPLGPGSILAEVRYMNARTDLGFTEVYKTQPFNQELGDVQGTNVLAGYRLSF